jgi:ubiquinone/menaquinone biosynthesis C-methylase UbiE
MSKGVFHSIAHIYGLFYNHQKKYYSRILSQNRAGLTFDRIASVLDVGSGTGALCSALSALGLKTTGIDPIEKIVKIAEEKTTGEGIVFHQGDILKGLDYKDGEFDLVISSYVAHGMNKPERILMYNEMYRLSLKYMIIYDYNKERRFWNDFVEWLEGGDYFNFILEAENELNELFGNVRTINVDKRAAWYIIEKGGA